MMQTSARLIVSRGQPERRRRVFTWRNVLRRRPRIEVQADCPLFLRRPRYYSYASIGSAVGTLLRFDVINRSDHGIHSYAWRYSSSMPQGNGAFGVQPERGLISGQVHEESCVIAWRCPISLTIDFVQFADGSMWFSPNERATVRPDGVQAGAAAAARYLLGLMDKQSAEAIPGALPRIHADVQPPAAPRDRDGVFGFYAGVTNIAVRVSDAISRGEIDKLADLLRPFCRAD